MIPYADFAYGLSGIVIVQYAVLLAIAIRRGGFRDRRTVQRTETVTAHARFLEGPIFTVLFLAALGTGLSAITIGNADYARVAGLVLASLRGALFMLAVWLLLWYWRQRETWR